MVAKCLHGCHVWLQVRQELAQEYEQVKDITNTLSSFKAESGNKNYEVDFGNYVRRDYHHRHEEPTRDPDVWPPPTPVEQK